MDTLVSSFPYLISRCELQLPVVHTGHASFFFLTKEYIHAIPHRQPWLHGAYLQSFDTTTTLMKLFLLAYRLQVMT